MSQDNQQDNAELANRRTDLLAMVEKGRWRVGKKLGDFLEDVEISEAKWKKLPSGKLRLNRDEVERIVKSLEMSDFERQKMLLLAGCADKLEEDVPATRIDWAFRCLIDNPEMSGRITKELKLKRIPLSLQSYFVLLFREKEGISLLRQEESLAVQTWLMEGFGIEVDKDESETKVNIGLLCDRPYLDSREFPDRDEIEELLLGLVDMRSRCWVSPEDIWWSDLDHYTGMGVKEDVEDDFEQWQDYQTDSDRDFLA